MNNLWLDKIKNKNIKKLNENINFDVLIIGGGITGLSIAYHLIGSNLSVCLVDKGEVGSGTTCRTTGKLTYLQGLIYEKITLNHSKKASIKYLTSQTEAIKIVENIVKRNNINCDLCKVKSYIYTNEDNKISKLKKVARFLIDNGIKVSVGTELPINISTKYYVSVSDSYVFHPIRYLYSLKQICLKNNIDIYENTMISKCQKVGNKYICKTDNNIIEAQIVVFACHYPYFTIPFMMPLKTHMEKSYIMVTNSQNNLKISGITDDKINFSFRSHADGKDNYLICLGESFNLCNQDNDKDNFNKLYKQSQNLIDDVKYSWTNRDIITSDYLPYIGRLNKNDNMFIATGYNTWGMTNGTIAGKIISDMILGRSNDYIDLFNPNRDINIGKIINTPNNIYSSMKAMLKTKLKKSNPNIKYTSINGQSVAIYKDELNKKHIVYNSCPHLKCGLMFNNYEKTWDCPCHGSRYDINGKCIMGPSKDDIYYKK